MQHKLHGLVGILQTVVATEPVEEVEVEAGIQHSWCSAGMGCVRNVLVEDSEALGDGVMEGSPVRVHELGLQVHVDDVVSGHDAGEAFVVLAGTGSSRLKGLKELQQLLPQSASLMYSASRSYCLGSRRRHTPMGSRSSTAVVSMSQVELHRVLQSR